MFSYSPAAKPSYIFHFHQYSPDATLLIHSPVSTQPTLCHWSFKCSSIPFSVFALFVSCFLGFFYLKPNFCLFLLFWLHFSSQSGSNLSVITIVLVIPHLNWNAYYPLCHPSKSSYITFPLFFKVFCWFFCLSSSQSAPPFYLYHLIVIL